MKRYSGRICVALLVVALGIVVVVQGDSLASAVVAGYADDTTRVLDRAGLRPDTRSYVRIEVNPGAREAWFKLCGKQIVEEPGPERGRRAVPRSHSVAKIRLF